MYDEDIWRCLAGTRHVQERNEETTTRRIYDDKTSLVFLLRGAKNQRKVLGIPHKGVLTRGCRHADCTSLRLELFVSQPSFMPAMGCCIEVQVTLDQYRDL
jgi:hypothetical protein